MRLSYVPLLALSAGLVSAQEPELVQPTPAPTALISNVVDDQSNVLELRQAPVQANPAAATAVAQIPPVTTFAQNTVVGGQTTYMTFVYTQTFADALGQAPSPGVGSIGMGTLTGKVGAVRTKKARSVDGTASAAAAPSSSSSSSAASSRLSGETGLTAVLFASFVGVVAGGALVL